MALIPIVFYALLVLHGWALVDCITRPTVAFSAAGKLTKTAWLAITGGALVFGYFDHLGLFGIAAIVASVVYLVDVRPAVKEIQGGNKW